MCIRDRLKADFIMANPPFNLSGWGADKLVDDVRWQYGTPPAGNTNFAWLQHMIWHLAPNGRIGMVLANGSLSSQSGGEGEIRKNIINADLVDCIVAMPTQLFYTTQIPVSVSYTHLFLGANIDAVETAKHFGIGADRAVNYHSDHKGTQLNYEALSLSLIHI